MLGALIQKELKSILLSPKFPATFGVCSLLILLSIFIGIQEYHNASEQYQTATRLTDQELQAQTSWAHMYTKQFRRPDPMQIFVSGVNYDIGRWSAIAGNQPVKLRHSAYSDDPIFAVFRVVDFAFIVRFILTLVALLFTYNAINGERENGTLKLVLSNSVPRAKYLLAKCAGTWLGLIIPLALPVLLGLLMVLLFSVPMTADHWLRLAGLLGISAGLFTFFVVLGVMISALSKRSSVSFLITLVIWIVAVVIVPRSGVMAATTMITVPRVAEIEGQSDAFAQDKWDNFYQNMSLSWEHSGNDDGELSDEEMWNMIQQQDSLREHVQVEIASFEQQLMDDLRRRKRTQEQLAFVLSRFSPASAYQLAAMSLAETGIASKTRYVEAMENYRSEFTSFTDEKFKESGDIGGMKISVMIDDSGKEEMKIESDRNAGQLDLTGLPKFSHPVSTPGEIYAGLVVDGGIILITILLAFAGAFVAFLRYDVR